MRCKAFVRRRSGPDKAVAAVGAYLRVSGPSGPLTGVFPDTEAIRLTAVSVSSYIIHLKATLFRPGGPGRRRFSGWAPLGAEMRTATLMAIYMFVVTTINAHRLRWEVLLGVRLENF